MSSALFILRIVQKKWNWFKALLSHKVRIHVNAMEAETLGVTSKNLDKARESKKPEVRRPAGLEGGFGAKLGVADAFVMRAAKAVGNYCEMFERNLGTGSHLRIPRGLNQLWSAGGVMFAPPMR